MANLDAPPRGSATAERTYVLSAGTLAAAAIAVCLAQVALAIPAVLAHETLLNPQTLSE